MATYLELHTLQSDSDLQDKVSVAVVKKAQTLLDAATPTAAQVTWANDAIDNPRGKALPLLNYVLAANSAASVAVIQAATDSTMYLRLSTTIRLTTFRPRTTPIPAEIQ